MSGLLDTSVQQTFVTNYGFLCPVMYTYWLVVLAEESLVRFGLSSNTLVVLKLEGSEWGMSGTDVLIMLVGQEVDIL